jgi:hypothetical protein
MTESIAESWGAAATAEPADDDPHHPLTVRKAAILTAAVGVAHALLVMTALLLLKMRAPDVRASDAALLAFYSEPENRRVYVIAGLYLIPFAGIAFIWFVVALRMWIRGSARREYVLVSNVQFVSGIIYTPLLLAAGAAMTVLAVSVEMSDAPIDPFAARQFPQYGTSLILVFAMRMAGMFVLSTTSITRSAKILPRWITVLSVAVAAGLFLTASLRSWLILVFPGWILVFCGILIDRARKISSEHVLPERGQETTFPGHSQSRLKVAAIRQPPCEAGSEGR